MPLGMTDDRVDWLVMPEAVLHVLELPLPEQWRRRRGDARV
jgi:hypothetical protein